MHEFPEDLYPVKWAGGQAVVALPEHIGISNAGQVREQLLSVINRGATTLIADMTATVSCDHAGAEALIRARQRAAASGTDLRLVITAQIVARVLSLVGLDRTLAQTEAGRGSGDVAAAQQAHLLMLDAVTTSLFHVRIGLQAALDLPADPARKRTVAALGDLDIVIGEIRGTVFAARDSSAPP
jgi:anti-anti-sigma factor